MILRKCPWKKGTLVYAKYREKELGQGIVVGKSKTRHGRIWGKVKVMFPKGRILILHHDMVYDGEINLAYYQNQHGFKIKYPKFKRRLKLKRRKIDHNAIDVENRPTLFDLI